MTSITYPLSTTPQAALGGAGSVCALQNFLGTPCGPLTVKGPTNYTYVEDKTWTSHEVDFVSTGDSPLQWLGGLYYYHETYNQPVTFASPNISQLANAAGGGHWAVDVHRAGGRRAQPDSIISSPPTRPCRPTPTQASVRSTGSSRRPGS